MGCQLLLLLGILCSFPFPGRAHQQPADSVLVDVSISNHYATTKIITKTTNRDTTNSATLDFVTEIPESAFVSEFRMSSDGKVFVGEVMEKKAARDVYDSAVQRGQSAGLVAKRDSNVFSQTANVGPGAQAVFELTFEQLLTKKAGWLEYNLDIPDVMRHGDLKVHGVVNEIDGVATFKSLTPVEPALEWDYGKDDSANFALAESVREISNLSFRYRTSHSSHEVGTFVVDQDGESFLHLFSPPKLDIFAKKVVFVLDKSWSMRGAKFNQLQEAVWGVIETFRPFDLFNIVFFDSDVEVWQSSLQQASPENKLKAKEYIFRDWRMGYTDIELGLRFAIDIMKEYADVGGAISYASQILLFTDGQPTSGITIPAVIRKEILRQNTEQIPIHSLGFGWDLDYPLIRAISLESNGFDRRIHEGSYVVEQLAEFFKEIDTATMTDIQLKYTTDVGPEPVDFVTGNSRRYLYEGSEFVASGILPSSATSVTVKASGTISSGQEIEYSETFKISDQGLDSKRPLSVQRTFAFLSIKQLQDRIDAETDQDKEQELKEAVMRTSIEHHFVTPYTSLVVVAESEFEDPASCGNDPPVEGKECQQSPEDILKPHEKSRTIYPHQAWPHRTIHARGAEAFVEVDVDIFDRYRAFESGPDEGWNGDYEGELYENDEYEDELYEDDEYEDERINDGDYEGELYENDEYEDELYEDDEYEDERINDILLLDVTPLSLGIAVGMAGKTEPLMFPIMARHSVIPYKQSLHIPLCDHKSGEKIKVHFYQGELAVASENRHICDLEFEIMDPGISHIDITIQIDANGVLDVHVKVGDQEYSKSFQSDQVIPSDEEITEILEKRDADVDDTYWIVRYAHKIAVSLLAEYQQQHLSEILQNGDILKRIQAVQNSGPGFYIFDVYHTLKFLSEALQREGLPDFPLQKLCCVL